MSYEVNHTLIGGEKFIVIEEGKTEHDIRSRNIQLLVVNGEFSEEDGTHWQKRRERSSELIICMDSGVKLVFKNTNTEISLLRNLIILAMQGPND